MLGSLFLALVVINYEHVPDFVHELLRPDGTGIRVLRSTVWFGYAGICCLIINLSLGQKKLQRLRICEAVVFILAGLSWGQFE